MSVKKEPVAVEPASREDEKTGGVAAEVKYSSEGLPVCRLCGEAIREMAPHIEKMHGMSPTDYQERYPDWPLEPLTLGAAIREGSLSYLDRPKEQYSVLETFGFYWNEKKKKDKMVWGYKSPGPLTPPIDPTYVFNPEYTPVLLLGLHKRNKVLCYGPSGSGKTSIWQQIAARLNYNCVRINFDAGISRADLVGQWIVKGKEMNFAHGILPKAMLLPGTIIIFDEWDSISEECSFVLQRPLEEHSQLMLLEKGEEVVTLHEDNLIVATANTAGLGDDTGLYSAGTRIQNFSQINRYQLCVIMDYLPPEEEAKILLKRFPDDVDQDEAEMMVAAANLIREAFQNKQLSTPISTRDVVNWAEKYAVWGNPLRAATYCFINRSPIEDRETLQKLIKRVMP